MSERRRRTLSYLLRLWPEKNRDQLVWRASLEGAQSGERWGFADFDDLDAFLRRQTGVVPEPDGNGKDPANGK